MNTQILLRSNYAPSSSQTDSPSESFVGQHSTDSHLEIGYGQSLPTAMQLEDVVIGGGPIGLAMAAWRAMRGCNVVLFERSPLAIPEDNDSSFNFTLVDRSLRFLQLLGVEIRPDCVEIVGRQIHTAAGHHLHQYGLRETDRLFSVPRRVLTAALLEVARRTGVTIVYGARMAELDSRRGKVQLMQSGNLYQIEARRIFVADGADSRGRAEISKQMDIGFHRCPDPFIYAMGNIDAAAARQSGIRFDHIQIVPGPGSVDLGIPNADGTISFLMERRTDRCIHTVADEEDLRIFKEGPPPVLRGLAVDLDGQIRRSPIRRFKYSYCDFYSFGHTVLLGDAARCWPPYLGQGVNAGIHDVAAFAAAELRHSNNWTAACLEYETDRKSNSQRLNQLSEQHGRQLLTGAFGSHRWRLHDRLERLLENYCGYRSLYQSLVFDTQFPSLPQTVNK